MIVPGDLFMEAGQWGQPTDLRPRARASRRAYAA